MARVIQVFNYKFEDEELENEFNNFFHRYNLTPLFTNDFRASDIRVSYVDARSVINPSGSYRSTLLEFSDYLTMSNDNKSYEEALFKIIYESRTMQAMMNKIRKLMQFINSSIDSDHMYNMWNIVFYNKDAY